MRSGGVAEYQKINAQTGVVDADPHRLVQMLMAGAVDRIALARGHLERNEVAQKGVVISKVITIISGLQAALDHEKGGKLSQDLDALYNYMNERLLHANLQNDMEALDEVAYLMGTIKEGWDGIREQALQMSAPAE